ncbi:MAG TPA: hypothetical protein VHY76_11115 [Acetobacteraceae bacterium]|nr:hypothetical protein [Acetobacteraceae bacterium]
MKKPSPLAGEGLFRNRVEGGKSGVAEITVPNVYRSNGIIQVVNSVLLSN